MAVKTMKTRAEQQLAEQYQALKAQLPGDETMRQRRDAAFALFEAAGLPGKRLEPWHYTDWRAMQSEAFEPVIEVSDAQMALASATPNPLADLATAGGLSINSQTSAILEVPDEIEILSFEHGLATSHPAMALLGTAMPDAADPMAALNTAMFANGPVGIVRKGAKLPAPIHSICVLAQGTPGAHFARGMLVVEEGAEVTIVDGLVCNSHVDKQINTVTEIIIGDNAKVEYLTFNGLCNQAMAFTALGVTMGSNAEFNTLNFAIGGKVARHQVHVTMTGEGSKLGVRGVSLLRGDQHGDSTLVVDHQAPGCESRELFRTVVDGNATGVFQGKIMVRRAAQKTDGQMASNALLLSDGAVMNNKPELEIFADDVVCAHGATCGALDENLLFYLQARGLPKQEAEALMIQAFVGEVLETVSDDKVRDRLGGLVETWLKGRAAA